MTCPTCKNEFIWTREAQRKFYSNKSKFGPFCSKECASKSKNTKPPENKRKVKCIETNIIYPSIKQASESLKVPYGQLWRCLNGKLKSTHKLHFKYE